MFRQKTCREHINKVNSLIVDTFQFPLQLEPQYAIRVLEVMAMEGFVLLPTAVTQ